MKVGHIIGGLTVTDVKRVNKLNLIQFLKEVDSYLQQGYSIDVNSARQVGLVLMADMFKTEAASNIKVGSVESKLETEKVEQTSVEEPVAEDTVKPVPEATEQSVESAVKEEEAVEDEAPIAEEQSPLTAKKTTTRSKKTS